VRPDQIVDWLALTGDTADNIPGVSGVGGKTAAKWLGEFGSVDALLERASEIASDRLRQNLQAAKDAVLRNQKMMKLRADLPCELDWELLRVRPPDFARLAPFLEKMEFHTMARELRDQASRLF
jgi:DNA polymerase-1